MTVPPTAVGTFRDKHGDFWINIEAVSDFLGVNFEHERRRIIAKGRFFHPHSFMRHQNPAKGPRIRYFIFSLPAHELLEWINAISETPSYKCPKSGKRFTADRQKLGFIRRTLKTQKALRKLSPPMEAISA